jgi:hypothetical protein
VYKRDGKVFAGHLQAKHKHLYEQGIWIFGDWDKALLAADFDPKETRMRRLWDREKIIKEIRAIRDRNLPLYAKYVIEQHQELFSSARRHFGSWSGALRE